MTTANRAKDIFHRIAAECMRKDSGASFSGADFRAMCGSGVYVYMRGDSVLYVGMGRAALSRCSFHNHQQASRARKECDCVLLYPCKSEAAARTLERLLITNLQPKYNHRIKNARRHYTTLAAR
jgi:excinuclease UvrABC nuclease subunit